VCANFLADLDLGLVGCSDVDHLDESVLAG
jgi:hypothetical protein